MNPLLMQFQDAALSGDSAGILHSIKSHPRLSAAQQFAIYSNGYRLRLINAIRSDYPALLSLIGDKLFDDIAAQYVESNPSISYTLDIYPRGFATFFAKQSGDVFATELAVLEQAIADAFILPDSAVLAPDALAGMAMDTFAAMRLPLRTASKLLRFEYPVHDWLIAQRAGQAPARPQAAPSYVLVYRHNNEVQRLVLSAIEFSILEKLSGGLKVGDALECALADNPNNAEAIAMSLQSWFAGWMKAGVFKDVK